MRKRRNPLPQHPTIATYVARPDLEKIIEPAGDHVALVDFPDFLDGVVEAFERVFTGVR